MEGQLERILGCPRDPLDCLEGCVLGDIKGGCRYVLEDWKRCPGGSLGVFQAVQDSPKTGRIRLDCLRSVRQL